jgi:hypothetical protein
MGVDKYPGIVQLNFYEQFLYCDPKMYQLIVILMINDSGSYTFVLMYKEEKDNNLDFRINSQV